jgi:Methyltransferase domain
MSLTELVDNTLTDKNTTHSYLELYESLLQQKKHSAKHVLEIGIGDFKHQNGGSIKLWRDYFKNATIYAIDIINISRVIDELKNDDRVILHTSTNAYNEEFVKANLLSLNTKFDVLLDDGPHTLKSMIQFIKLYSPLMADDGILIIEDVQQINWIDILKSTVPTELKPFIKIYDLRDNKRRYDDIVFVIDKSNSKNTIFSYLYSFFSSKT